MKTDYFKKVKLGFLCSLMIIAVCSFFACTSDMEEDELLEEKSNYKKVIIADYWNNSELRNIVIKDSRACLKHNEESDIWYFQIIDDISALNNMFIVNDISDGWKEYVNPYGVYYGYFFQVSGKAEYIYSKVYGGGGWCGTGSTSHCYRFNPNKMKILPLVEKK